MRLDESFMNTAIAGLLELYGHPVGCTARGYRSFPRRRESNHHIRNSKLDTDKSIRV